MEGTTWFDNTGSEPDLREEDGAALEKVGAFAAITVGASVGRMVVLSSPPWVTVQWLRTPPATATATSAST